MSLDINKVSVKTSLAHLFGNKIKDLVQASEFFNELASKAEEITIPANEYVLRENDPNDYVYIAVSGSVMLERSTSTGSRQIFAFLFTGNIIGVSELPYYTFSARTLTETTLIKVNQKLIKNTFESHPIIAHRYQEVTSHILSLILDQLFIMGQKSAHQRIAYFLLDMKHRLGHGTSKFHLPMSRQDIADYLGMSLETSSRGFSRLKREELITVKNNYQVAILDAEKLKIYADS